MKARIIESDVKKNTQPITIGDKTYDISFTLNVIDEIQGKYGGLNNLADVVEKTSELKWLIALLVNEAIEEHNEDYPDDIWEKVTESYIGRRIDSFNLNTVTKSIFAALGASMPADKSIGNIDDELNAELADIENSEPEKNTIAEQ
ncbi:MAG: hypothetical protein IJA02_08930 [Clostridia bacterium]|nr:hypothetical protein [Clostridia bacterium]